MSRLRLEPSKRRASDLRSTTLREFDGGWDVVDSDYNMKPKFAPVFDNVVVDDNGTVQVRGGCALFCDLNVSGIQNVPVQVIGATYFQDHIIIRDGYGEVAAINAAGDVIVAFGDVEGTAMLASPDEAMLAGTDQSSDDLVTMLASPQPTALVDGARLATYTTFKGDLISCDGLNKPIKINTLQTPIVQYLVDLGTGSNANTPIGLYCQTIGEYVCIAGDPQYLDRVWISARGTSGTWFGDPEPNDATFIDVSQYAAVQDVSIRGLGRYREFLMVMFEDAIVPVTLGNYDAEGNHKPTIGDVIVGVGTMSHRSIANIGIDMLFGSITGVTSIARVREASGIIEPEQISELIDPAIVRLMERQSTSNLLYDVWGLFDPAQDRYMLFVPNFDTNSSIKLVTDPVVLNIREPTRVRFYARNHGLEVGDHVVITGCTQIGVTNAHTKINSATGWNVLSVINTEWFELDVTTLAGYQFTDSVVMGGGSNIRIHYDRTETQGFVLNQARTNNRAWSRWKGLDLRAGCVSSQKRVFVFGVDGKCYLMSGLLDKYSADFIDGDTATPIKFAWELPWGDFGQRKHIKRSRYISLDTEGDGRFDLSMFLDGFMYRPDGTLSPHLSASMIGGGSGGYGKGPQGYGGGRNARDARLYEWPAKFEIAKLRFDGETVKPLSFSSITLLYQLGDVRM